MNVRVSMRTIWNKGLCRKHTGLGGGGSKYIPDVNYNVGYGHTKRWGPKFPENPSHALCNCE